MNTLLEILKHTQYEAKGTHEAWLLEELKKGLSREEVKGQWEQSGKKSDHFRQVYKGLKDGLLVNLLTSPTGLEAIQAGRARAWRKMAESKVILIAGERKSATEIATEAVGMAEKYGLAEIVLSLANNLSYYYSVLKPDFKQYRKYQSKYENALNDVSMEFKANSVLTEMTLRVKKSFPVIELMKRVNGLDENASDNVFYRISYYTTLLLWHRIYNDVEGQLIICGKAIRFFENTPFATSYVMHWNFRRQMVLAHLSKGEIKQAERRLIECLKFPKKGDYNWHITQQLRCRVGFFSGKPKMVTDAITRAENTRRLFESPPIMEMWEIVKAWKAVLSLAKGEKVNFKLGRFLNSVPMCSKDKKGLNVQILILKHLLYLFNNRKVEFMESSMNLPQYCSQYLRGKAYSRGRCMLMILSRIDRERLQPQPGRKSHQQMASGVVAGTWRRRTGMGALRTGAGDGVGELEVRGRTC